MPGDYQKRAPSQPHPPMNMVGSDEVFLDGRTKAIVVVIRDLDQPEEERVARNKNLDSLAEARAFIKWCMAHWDEIQELRKRRES